MEGGTTVSGRSRTALVLLLVLGLVVLVAGAGGCARDVDTFVFYINEPYVIDPVNAQEEMGINVVNAVFDGLLDFDPKTSELIPAVAESWEPNADATVWTFNLREGAKFHNGRDVTAEDFKYAWERILNVPESGSEIAYHLDPILGAVEMQSGEAAEAEGIRVVDDLTLEVTLAYPFADFEYVVAHPSLAPVPREEVEADPDAYAMMPVGNGPFMMSEPWAPGQYIRVERFDDYWGEPALLDAVEFKIFSDEETAYLEFRAGNVDFTTIPSGQIQSAIDEYGESSDGWEAAPGSQVLLGGELSTLYVVMNNEDEHLSNADLRRAISLAIDRETIAQTVYEGTRTPATNIVPEGIIGWEDGAWEYSRYDVPEAERLLAEAGYPGGEGLPTLQLAYNTGDGHEPLMQLIQQNLRDIGIETEFDPMEFAQLLDVYYEGAHQLGRLGWVVDYPIMDNFLYPLFLSTSADNLAFYDDPEVDEALVAARQIAEEDERVRAYQEIARTIGDDAPVVPVVMYRHRHVVSERVRGFVYSPMILANLHEVWLADDEE